MKSHIFPAIKLTLVFCVFFVGIYTISILGISKLTSNNGEGEMITEDSKKYYENIGQGFTNDKYFYSRPSAVGYNASGSGGSNKGTSNPDYLKDVQARIDSFLVHNPEIDKSQISSDIVTYSGSGLDPNISVEAALIQVKRIAKIRNISESSVLQLIEAKTEKPLLGLFGIPKLNVLKLNLALDKGK